MTELTKEEQQKQNEEIKRKEEENKLERVLQKCFDGEVIDCSGKKQFFRDVFSMTSDEIIDESLKIINKKSKLSANSRLYCLAIAHKLNILKFKKNSK